MNERGSLLVHNTTRDTSLVTRGWVADRLLARMRGLLGHAPLHEGEGLLITPCTSIHMFFMRFPIDAVYLSRDRKVVGLDRDLRPWRTGRFYKRVFSVLELPAGTIASTGTALGDQLCVNNGAR